MSPKGDGLILRKITTEFKFVSTQILCAGMHCEVVDDVVSPCNTQTISPSTTDSAGSQSEAWMPSFSRS